MSKQTTKPYSAEFKEQAVKLAVESDQTVIASKARKGHFVKALDHW